MHDFAENTAYIYELAKKQQLFTYDLTENNEYIMIYEIAKKQLLYYFPKNTAYIYENAKIDVNVYEFALNNAYIDQFAKITIHIQNKSSAISNQVQFCDKTDKERQIGFLLPDHTGFMALMEKYFYQVLNKHFDSGDTRR